MSRFTDDPNQAAKLYISTLQAAPIPTRYKTKIPVHTEWEKLRLQESEVDNYFPNSPLNISLIFGAASNGLADIDLDCPEAVALASDFLPETDLVFGRKSNGYASHRIYRVIGNHDFKTKQFKDIDRSGGSKEKLKLMIVELRGSEAQTVVPPSVHVEGEPIRYSMEGDPASIDYQELKGAAGKLAAAVVLCRSWPQEGGRNDAALAVSGLLLANGCSVEFVEHFLTAVTEKAGDEESEARVRTVAATQKKIDDGEPITGHQQLCDIIGKSAVKKILEFLGIKQVNGRSNLCAAQTRKAHEPIVDKINERYALILVGGQAVILKKNPPELGLNPWELISISAFETYFRNRTVIVGTKQYTHAQLWLSHPNRNELKDILSVRLAARSQFTIFIMGLL